MKFFNTAGPVNPEKHYCVPLSMRLDEQELYQLIDQEKYFILHAPRQTGKTSTMLNFAQQLNREGKHNVLYVNVEAAQASRGDYIQGAYTILEELLSCIEEQLPEEKKIIIYLSRYIDAQKFSGASFGHVLRYWAKNSAKPVIFFIDEIDSLVGDTLISVLRQLAQELSQG